MLRACICRAHGESASAGSRKGGCFVHGAPVDGVFQKIARTEVLGDRMQHITTYYDQTMIQQHIYSNRMRQDLPSKRALNIQLNSKFCLISTLKWTPKAWVYHRIKYEKVHVSYSTRDSVWPMSSRLIDRDAHMYVDRANHGAAS